MSIKLDQEKYKNACIYAFEKVRKHIVPNPKTRYITSTGNLAFNAFRYRWEGDYGLTFHVYVDEDIAPYMVYTNERWISPRWHGKKNPNENWWDRAREDLVNYIAEYYEEHAKEQR